MTCIQYVNNARYPLPSLNMSATKSEDLSNFSTDAHGNTFKKGDFKDKLNQAATNGGLNQPPSSGEGVVDKGQFPFFDSL